MPAEDYSFVENRPRDGRKFRVLNVVDEFTRKCLAIRDARRLKSADAIDMLANLFTMRTALVHGADCGEIYRVTF